MLDVSDIHLIQTIAEVGSINKAADKLFMSQPTLSKRISRLEQVLKIDLFHRHSTGMTPTSAASYLIENGKQIQGKLDAMCRHVELLSELQGGSLNIGAGPISEQLFFPKVLVDFLEDTRDVKTVLRIGVTDELLAMVIDGQLDIAIGPFEPSELPKDLLVTPLRTEQIIFVVRPGHPLANKDIDDIYAAFEQYSLIGPSITSSVAKYMNYEKSPGMVKVSCDNYRISKSVVMTSDYITGGPALLFARELAAGELVELKADYDFPLALPLHHPT